MGKKRTNLSSSMKPIDIHGVKVETDKEPEEYIEYFLKKAKLLNGFFQVNKIKEPHEDLQIIAMYLAVQIAMGIMSKSDLQEIQEEIYKIADALKPRLGKE